MRGVAWRAAAHSRLPSSSTISICPPSSHERGIAPSRKRCTSSSASPARTNCTAAPVRGCVSAKMRASVRSGQLATKTRRDIAGLWAGRGSLRGEPGLWRQEKKGGERKCANHSAAPRAHVAAVKGYLLYPPSRARTCQTCVHRPGRHTTRDAPRLNRTATEAALFATDGAADGTGPWLRNMALVLDVHGETKVQEPE